MLSRFSEVLQSAADVLAPPASRLEDFEYHWRQIQHFYQNHDDASKVQIEETKLPLHLHQMLQLLVDEEKEIGSDVTVGPCLEKLIDREIRILDALTAIAGVDRPAGARAAALAWCTALLRRHRRPLVNHVSIYQPIQRLLIQCNENVASPTEKEEVELLLTLCGLVRKEPDLANIFTTPYIEIKMHLLSIPEDILEIIPLKPKVQTPKKNPLFEVELPADPIKKIAIVSQNFSERERLTSDGQSSVAGDEASLRSQKTVYEDNDKFLLMDLLLSYLSSADNHIVLRACEGIMIVSSLPDDDIANLVTSCSSVCENLIEKLVLKFKSIPANVDPCDVEHLNITWGYVAQDFIEKGPNFDGYRELTSFFSWLDYCDTLMKECHSLIAGHLARTFRQGFLEGTVECGLVNLHHTILVTAIISKCLKVIDSTEFISEISNWLVGDGEIEEWPLLHTVINNCLSENYDLTLETLKFFEAIIEKPTEHSLQRLVLCRLSSRSYYCPLSQVSYEDEDEERDRLNDVSLQRERDSNRQAMKQLEHEGYVNEQINGILSHEGLDNEHAVNSDNIHKVINSFLLLLPKAILSDPVGADYEQYIHDAHRHYQAWLDITSTFNWPIDNFFDNTASSTHSYDSRPEADFHLNPNDIKAKDDEVFEITTGHTGPSNTYEHNNTGQEGTQKQNDNFDPSKDFVSGQENTKKVNNFQETPSINYECTTGNTIHDKIHKYIKHGNPALDNPEKTINIIETGNTYSENMEITNDNPPKSGNFKPGSTVSENTRNLVKNQDNTHGNTVKKESNSRSIDAENPQIQRKTSPSGKFLGKFENKCCNPDNIGKNILGRCGKTASQCPFSQNLVLRSRDLTATYQNEEIFYEGPFLNMIFKLLSNMTKQTYQINLQLTSIVSKLAMLPHLNLHEYLLNPMLPTAKTTKTLFKVLQDLAKRLTIEIPRVRNYKKLIEDTRIQLMSEDPNYDISGEHNQLFESLIVVEEFCKELAAIAFVKYQHSIQINR